MERLSQVPSFQELDFKLTDNYIPSSTNSKNNIPCSLEYTVSIVSIHELMTDSNYRIRDPERHETIEDNKTQHLKMSFGNYVTAADSIMKDNVDRINEDGIKRIKCRSIDETTNNRPKIAKDICIEQSDRQRVRSNSIGQNSRKRITSLQHKNIKNPNTFTRNRSNTLISKKKEVEDKSMFAQFNSEAAPIIKRANSGKQKPRGSLQDKKGGFLEDKDFNIFSNAFTVKQIKLKSDQMREKTYLKKLIQNRATIIHISERNELCNKHNFDLMNHKLGKLIQNRF